MRDALRIREKKVEIYSLPYSSIYMRPTDNAGKFLDYRTELELWTKADHIKMILNYGIDIRKFDKIIAYALLVKKCSGRNCILSISIWLQMIRF